MIEVKDGVIITIDGRPLKTSAGRILLEVARENNIDIPGFCYRPHMTPAEACGLCLVRVDGEEELACSVEIEDGMEVTAFADDLEEKRRRLVDEMLKDHNFDCINCEAAGDCVVQDLGYRYGLIGLSSEKFRDLYHDAISRKKSFPLSNGNGRAEEISPYQNGSSVTYSGEPSDCVRCGYCVDICPMELYPLLILEASSLYIQPGSLKGLNPEDCINCGLCSFVCPGKIKIPDYFPQNISPKGGENNVKI